MQKLTGSKGGEEQGNARRLGFEPLPYFGGWISRRTCNLNIPALRGVKKRYL